VKHSYTGASLIGQTNRSPSTACCSPSATSTTAAANCNPSVHIAGSDTSSPVTNSSASPQSVHYQPVSSLSSQRQLIQAHSNSRTAFQSSFDHLGIVPSASSAAISDLSHFPRPTTTGNEYNQPHPYDTPTSASQTTGSQSPYATYNANTMRQNDKFFYHHQNQGQHIKGDQIQRDQNQQNIYPHQKYAAPQQNVYDFTQTQNQHQTSTTTANMSSYSGADYFTSNHYQSQGQSHHKQHQTSGYSLHSLEAR
jgi:hypothetical protein